METRGDASSIQAKTYRVARRSCDQCRARKVGCDRGSPCSPCTSARLSCTHSAVAQSTATPKQRVLISTQYEQKIDRIAGDVHEIKKNLEALQASIAKSPSKASTIPHTTRESPGLHLEDVTDSSSAGDELSWRSSVHVIGFIKSVVGEAAIRGMDCDAEQTISSLRKLLQKLDVPQTTAAFSGRVFQQPPDIDTSLPPQDSVVAVLRWAKEHASNVRIAWLTQLLPLERFIAICQKIYFAVDRPSDIDYILANGFLGYVFFEHLVVSGRSDFVEHSQRCRKNLSTSLRRLPLILSSSMEVIAALTLGAYNAVEDSRTSAAWTFISAAANHCLTIFQNYSQIDSGLDKGLAIAQENLFWAVYRLEKGISLRLGRSCVLRDAYITLPIPNDPRMQTASIQGRVYDELYCPKALTRDDFDRRCVAELLATELRQCIADTKAVISRDFNQTTLVDDPVGKTYAQCELICQHSLLTLILRAMPTPLGSPSSITGACLSAAREALHVHEECITTLRECKNEPLMLARYVNWAIVHCPFPPFSILLSHTIELTDASELCSLERFALSLQPHDSSASPDPAAQPAHLYTLLCKAARLYLGFHTAPTTSDPLGLQPGAFGSVDPAGHGMDLFTEQNGNGEGWLGDWYYDNQLVMGVLDQNAF